MERRCILKEMIELRRAIRALMREARATVATFSDGKCHSHAAGRSVIRITSISLMKCDREKRMIDDSDDTTKRRLQCRTAPKVLDLAGPRDARFVKASLVSSGTTRGEPPFVPRSASIASELAGQVTAVGWAGSKSP